MGPCQISCLWMQLTADHKSYIRHVSINKIWWQSAITAQGGRQCMQLAGDHSNYSTHDMKESVVDRFMQLNNLTIWRKVNRKNSPGATMISFFLERTRRKVSSFWGSMSRTQLRAWAERLCSRPAYCTVVELSIVVRTGIPAYQQSFLAIQPSSSSSSSAALFYSYQSQNLSALKQLQISEKGYFPNFKHCKKVTYITIIYTVLHMC